MASQDVRAVPGSADQHDGLIFAQICAERLQEILHHSSIRIRKCYARASIDDAGLTPFFRAAYIDNRHRLFQ
jgi:hypothetical protein